MPKSSLPLAFFSLCAVLFAWANQNDPFFWDTVQLGSKHAHFFYDNGLRWAPLPADIDSGHPPVFGWLLAACWTVFGKTLPVGHWMMLPFLIGNIFLLWRLGRQLGGDQWAFWLLPLVLLDPVVLGQSALVSPDIALLFWFLLSVEALSADRRWPLVLGILGLCSISMRGMMTAGALFASMSLQVMLVRVSVWDKAKALSLFLPGFVFAAWFLIWHLLATGWLGFHAGSPWAGAFSRVDAAGFLKNCAIVGWRWTDFGRGFEWLVVFFFLFSPRLKPWVNKQWWLYLVLLLLFLTPSALLYRNLSAHRYFLPAFVVFHLIVFQGIVQCGWSNFWKKTVLLGLIIGMATGNLWIYPRGISMDWDSTLAHQPYHRLRADMIRFLETQNIDFSTVGSAFPNLNSGENLLLDGDQRQFAAKDFEHNDYVLASNVFNDFSEADYAVLEKNWRLVKRVEHAGVWMELYRRP